MIAMTLAHIARIVGAAPPADGNVAVTSVEFDSRRVTPGALFIALTGDQADGHDFAGSAAASGAVAVLGSRELPAGAGVPLIRCANNAAVLTGLQRIAKQSATELIRGGLCVVGVTGSAGKTSTKDLIAALAARQGATTSPPGSYNNEIGHPYTVLQADQHTATLVLELSARGIGHITALTEIAPPKIGAVLNVGSAHLGEFGSREIIAQAKGELVEALPSAADGGVAVLNADDDLVAAMSSRTDAAIVTFGTRAEATVRADNIELDDGARASFTLVTPEGSAAVSLRLVGTHQISNALAAAAVARALGLPLATIVEVLSAAEPMSPWRMDVRHLPGDITLINDAYNANPESMRAAIDSTARIAGDNRGWAVLGEMGELGAAATASHRDIGAYAAAAGLRVIAVGPAAQAIYDGALLSTNNAPEPAQVGDTQDAIDLVSAEMRPGDVILVKASRSVGLERVATAISERGTAKYERKQPAAPASETRQERR